MKPILFLLAAGAAAIFFATSAISSSIGKPSGGGASQGLYASAPTCNAAAAGTVYYATDAGLDGECNGTAWIWHYGDMVVLPTSTSGASLWLNQNTGTAMATVGANNAGSSVILTSGSNSGVQVQGRMRTVPATPYTYIVCAAVIGGQGNAQAGLLWSDGLNAVTSKLSAMSLSVLNNFTIGTQMLWGKFTNVGTLSANYSPAVGQVNNMDLGFPKCYALVDNGTNRKVGFSTDKSYWYLGNFAAVSNTDFLTPTHLGYYVNSNLSQGLIVMNVFSEEVVASALF